jgi:ubiquinone/menaquinone biosynthesis C-methylase UbiE
MAKRIGGFEDSPTWSARYIDRLYQIVAGIYPAYVTIGSLGAFPGLYHRACAALRLRPGDTVFDLCCGTGLLIPHLAAAVGPHGSIVGVDRSPAMLRQARLLSQHLEIEIVRFIQSDLAQFRPERPMDAAITCIALSCIPDCENILSGLLPFLRPGGRLVVVDSFINKGRWYYAISNLYNRTKGVLIQADPENGIRDVMRQQLFDYEEKLIHLGVYSLLSGSRAQPTTPAR